MVKKTILGIAAAIAALVLILSVVIAVQPEDYRVTRSAEMAAEPDEVFAQINDFHNWEAWSPWAKLDPNAKNTFEGATSGEGAKFGWAGNDKVGEGKMTIVESKPPELVRMKLEFIKPMAGVCDTEFAFKPVGEKTAVTWTMSGKNDFMGKAFNLIMDCDAMIGTDFEKGLANIKAVVEAPSKSEEPAATAVTTTEVSQ